MLWWTDELSTGISSIDEQHKGIFDKAERIMQFDETTSKDLVEDAFMFLINYVIEHFGSEEITMIKYCYNDFESHREKHTLLINNLNIFYRDFSNKGLTPKLLDDIKLLIVKWLINHIDQDDKKFAYFISKQL